MNPFLRPIIIGSLGLIALSIILISWFSASKKIGNMTITEIKNSTTPNKAVARVRNSLKLFFVASTIFLLSLSLDIGIVIYNWFVDLHTATPKEKSLASLFSVINLIVRGGIY